jgi:hypothetical protein
MRKYQPQALAFATLVFGCVTAQPSFEQAGQPASEVINSLKNELRYMNRYLIKNQDQITFSGTAACKTKAPFQVKLKTAKVTLKGVVSMENDPTVTAKLYIISAGYTGAFSTAKSETVEFDFDAPGMDNMADTGSVDDKTDAGSVNNHELTRVVFAALKALSGANHEVKPCFVNPKFSTTVSFDVKSSHSGTIGVDFVIVSIGDKQTWSNEQVQTIELDFETTGIVLLN